jgi:hypothetical protein
MSTQRRENRWRRTSCTDSEAPRWRFLPDGVQRAGPSGAFVPGAARRCSCASASGGTAPPGILVDRLSDEDLSPGSPAWLATNSLLSGHRIVQIVLLVRQDHCHSSTLFGAGLGAATGTPATHGASLRRILSPSGFARIHPTLPQFPAGRRRRAERYDGKRDLYFQHAA